jgi:lysophospholipase L1-like esterase
MAFDAIRGWRLLPNVTKRALHDRQPYTITTNSRGLRDREYSYERPGDLFRIVVIGDSQTFGLGGVEAAETFSKRLEGSAPGLQVINMGVPAYSTDQEYLYLQSEGIKYRPNLVVLAVYENDFVITFDSWDNSIGLPKCYFTLNNGNLQYHPPQASLLYKWSNWSYLSGIVLDRHRKLSRGAGWQPAPKLNTVDQQELFKRFLIEMHRICRPAGADFLVMYIPVHGQKKRFALQDAMAEAAANDGFRTLDLTTTLLEANQLQPAYIDGDIHLNRRGHQIVADALHNAVAPLLSGGKPAETL